MAARKTNRQGIRSDAKRSGRLGPGQAPPIGFENAAKARENIRAKLTVVEAWAKNIVERDGDDSDDLLVPFDMLPLSQRDFNAWDSAAFSTSAVSTYGTFHKNGNATLLKSNDILESLRNYFVILKRFKTAGPAQKKQETIASLQRRLAMEKTLRGIAEKELTRARAQVWRCQKEEETLRAEVKSAGAKAREMIDELEALLAQVLAERSELARTLKKVSGIKLAAR